MLSNNLDGVEIERGSGLGDPVVSKKLEMWKRMERFSYVCMALQTFLNFWSFLEETTLHHEQKTKWYG